MLHKRSLASDIVLTGGLQLVWIAVTLLTNVFVARSLGPDGKGVVDYYLLIIYFEAEFASLGVASGIVYLVSHKEIAPAEGHGICIGLALILGLVAGGLLVTYALLQPGIYSAAMLIAGIACPFVLYRLYWGNLAMGLNEAPITYATQLVSAVLAALGVVWLFEIGRLSTTVAALALTVATTLTAVGVGLAYSARVGTRWDGRLALRAWHVSKALFLGHGVNLVTFRLDQLAVAYYFGPAALGIYALAVRLSESFWLLDQVFISAALYRISSLPDEQSWALTRRIAMAIGGLGMVTFGLAWVFGESVIVLFFGAAFQSVQVLFLILLGASALWSVARVLTQYLGFGIGRFRDCTFGAIVGGMVTVGLLGYLIFIQRGATLTAVASVSLVSYAVTALTYCVLIVKARRAMYAA